MRHKKLFAAVLFAATHVVFAPASPALAADAPILYRCGEMGVANSTVSLKVRDNDLKLSVPASANSAFVYFLEPDSSSARTQQNAAAKRWNGQAWVKARPSDHLAYRRVGMSPTFEFRGGEVSQVLVDPSLIHGDGAGTLILDLRDAGLGVGSLARPLAFGCNRVDE